MTPFAFNVLLAIVWTALTGRLDLFNFALGMAFGALALFFSRSIWDGYSYFRRIGRALGLIGWSLVELASAGFVEAVNAFRIGRQAAPQRFEVPLTVDREAEIALLAALVSLSPGTMVVGLSSDRARLIVQTSSKRRTALEGRITRFLERQILEVMR
jgi:multicomponent Na+:H+ antiporter subunit E